MTYIENNNLRVMKEETLREQQREREMPEFEVWYRKDPSFREDDVPLDFKDLRERWAFVRKVEAPNLGIVYHKQQGEIWMLEKSSEEIRKLIKAAGLKHTSMSVGDLIMESSNGTWWIVAGIGFNKVKLKNDCTQWGENRADEYYFDVGCVIGHSFCDPCRCDDYQRKVKA